MLFNFLLVNITILFCFYFLFLIISLLCISFHFFASPVDNKNARLKLVLAIPTGAPITVSNDAIEMLPLVGDQSNQKKQFIY